MKKTLVLIFLLALSCSDDRNKYQAQPRDWDDVPTAANPMPESSIYDHYKTCLDHGYSPQVCSQQNNVVIHERDGNIFMERLGEYFLISSLIGGRPYNYYSSYGYMPSLGYGYPSYSSFHYYHTNYRTLPSRTVYVQERRQSAPERQRKAEQIKSLRKENQDLKAKEAKRQERRDRQTEVAKQKRDEQVKSRSTNTDPGTKTTTSVPKTQSKPAPSPTPKTPKSSSSPSSRRK